MRAAAGPNIPDGTPGYGVSATPLVTAFAAKG
jgi:hypothetical protein